MGVLKIFHGRPFMPEGRSSPRWSVLATNRDLSRPAVRAAGST